MQLLALPLLVGSCLLSLFCHCLSAVCMQGRCTLLLGPPGSGTTTFLRVLGNRMRGCSRLNVSGDVTYNGHSKDEFCVQRTTALVDQRDNHITNLSVAETAEFAHKCHTGYKQPAFSLAGELRRAKVSGGSGGGWHVVCACLRERVCRGATDDVGLRLFFGAAATQHTGRKKHGRHSAVSVQGGARQPARHQQRVGPERRRPGA